MSGVTRVLTKQDFLALEKTDEIVVFGKPIYQKYIDRDGFKSIRLRDNFDEAAQALKDDSRFLRLSRAAKVKADIIKLREDKFISKHQMDLLLRSPLLPLDQIELAVWKIKQIQTQAIEDGRNAPLERSELIDALKLAGFLNSEPGPAPE